MKKKHAPDAGKTTPTNKPLTLDDLGLKLDDLEMVTGAGIQPVGPRRDIGPRGFDD